jgi:hypothetical protein
MTWSKTISLLQPFNNKDVKQIEGQQCLISKKVHA